MRVDEGLVRIHRLVPVEVLPLAMEEVRRRKDQAQMTYVEAIESVGDDARAGRLHL